MAMGRGGMVVSLSCPGVQQGLWRLIQGAQRSGLFAQSSSPHPVSPTLPQATAETVYDILSPAAPIPRSLQDKRPTRRRKGQQPADLREGVAKAYDTVREVLRPCPAPSPSRSVPASPHKPLC